MLRITDSEKHLILRLIKEQQTHINRDFSQLERSDRMETWNKIYEECKRQGHGWTRTRDSRWLASKWSKWKDEFKQKRLRQLKNRRVLKPNTFDYLIWEILGKRDEALIVNNLLDRESQWALESKQKVEIKEGVAESGSRSSADDCTRVVYPDRDYLYPPIVHSQSSSNHEDNSGCQNKHAQTAEDFRNDQTFHKLRMHEIHQMIQLKNQQMELNRQQLKINSRMFYKLELQIY